MLDDQLYREELLDVFRNPKNRGELSNPDFESKLLNPLCGDEVTLQIKLKNKQSLRPAGLKQSLRSGELGSVVEKAVFSGNGCAISQASASLLAEKIEGKNLDKIRKLKGNDILELIGINPSPARLKCALLSLEVLMDALKDGNLRN